MSDIYKLGEPGYEDGPPLIYGNAQSDAAEAGSFQPVYLKNMLEPCTKEESDAYHRVLGAIMPDEADPNIVAEDLVRINDSGIVPTEFKVLVLPDESETQIRARRSNIAVPEAYAAMYAHGSVTGRIIAMSPAAFSYHDWPAASRLPVIGERIVFARYAGMLVQGKPVINERGHEEPREYRLLNDKDIVAVLEF